MVTKGIELISETPPTISEKAISVSMRYLGIPLIIGIQLVFLFLLGFHFKLNQDLVSLAAAVAEKEATLAQGQELEKDFRNTQAKLETITTVKEGLCYACVIQVLEKLTPPLVTITAAELTPSQTGANGEFALAAETYHSPSLILFVANLLDEEAITKATFLSGNLGDNGRFTFTMELLFDQELVETRSSEESTK